MPFDSYDPAADIWPLGQWGDVAQAIDFTLRHAALLPLERAGLTDCLDDIRGFLLSNDEILEATPWPGAPQEVPSALSP